MKKTLHDLPREALVGATVAVRVDFNVPLAEGRIADATRIEQSVPTIRRLTSAGAKVVLLSHLGRPGGQARAGLTLEPAAECLEEMLGASVRFCPHAEGRRVSQAAREMEPGRVLRLVHTRCLV